MEKKEEFEIKNTEIMNNTNNKIFSSKNVIGLTEHRNFIEVQAIYGIAQRGGSNTTGFSNKQTKRLVSDINLLEKTELKRLIFGESIFGN